MLDNGTKRRIDTARDILVGKIPDPKSQVEQITIALIYKFMDDMDAESEELGGTRNFFAGEFARYGWAKLMRSGLGGYETLNLYADAIARMPENPGIPLLFRNIFKNAYLPYRDPETLRAFLKIIDEFTYDHSERLGDAFEYLLSVLGSQGDAGQFRTPRHIIDFIVAIVDPKKHETILDPACGTAGFLISSYKHILNNNLDENGYTTLTPDDKGRMVGNFSGYDISPDMVRLSLVNMYLHGFSDPHIFEYDTLTSQDRWNEYTDVILANPPFMSPKGGIRPHNRFSVQSKRSEVLFVDYIADHLTPDGRAGVIVPEGIIFQSQNAYKQLRKKLLEESLVAVISLPAGVFQPYSGVKTSILVLDKALAKKADTIAFFKVENDGFGLGAQRRPSDKNDLPQVLREVRGYLDNVKAGDCPDEYTPAIGLIVKREKVAENGEYNLSGERYRERILTNICDYDFKPLGKLCTIRTGKKDVNSGNANGKYPFFTCAQKHTYSDEYSFDTEAILIAGNGDVGSVQYYSGKFEAYQRTYVLTDWQDVDGRYLYFLLKNRLKKTVAMLKLGNTMPYIKLAMLSDFELPLPPLETQKEIVVEIESYQKVIDGARAVVENYRPHIPIDPIWPMVTIGVLSDQIQYGISTQLNMDRKGYKTFRMNEIDEGKCVDSGDMKYADIITNEFEKYRLLHGDILFNRTNSFEHVGRTGIFDLIGDYCFASYLIRITISKKIANPFYVNAFMNSDSFQKGIKRFASRAIGQSNINAKNLSAYPIPLPPLETQKILVAEIETEQRLINANRELIELFQDKIKAVINRVWADM
jgi:type I restriction enzyme M protein